ncbi:MAG: hypothetical protein IIA00_05095 [Proteobacteria bacterium]|nr:hypothetical protein [Pseudomonadota bacterium]
MARKPRPLDLLDWYIEAGADEAIGEAPRNRFEEPEPERGGEPEWEETEALRSIPSPL